MEENKTPHSQALLRVIDDTITAVDTDNNNELDIAQFTDMLRNLVKHENKELLDNPENIHKIMAYLADEELNMPSEDAIKEVADGKGKLLKYKNGLTKFIESKIEDLIPEMSEIKMEEVEEIPE